MKRLYSGMYGSNCHPFNVLADKCEVAGKPSDMVEEDSALVIWGGADINPSYYNHPQSRTTYPSSVRDPVEWALIHRAIAMGIPIIGVCRGAQMLCAAAGGFLIQDVRGHAGSNHYVTAYDGTKFLVNSIHHQMLGIPDQVDHELLGWSTANLSKEYIWKDDKKYEPPTGFKEPEMVVFPSIKGLAIQWHPEGMSSNSEATQFILKEYHARFSTSKV